MENLYAVVEHVYEYEEGYEYCYIVRAYKIKDALSYFMKRKKLRYELKSDKDKYIEGIMKDEYGIACGKFSISKLKFDESNVIIMSGYKK